MKMDRLKIYLRYPDLDEGPGPDTQVNIDGIQEQEIVRLLLAFGHELVNWDDIDNMYIGSFIIQNLTDVYFEDKICNTYY